MFYLQATQPINSNGENDTVFVNTYLGGIIPEQEILVGAGAKSFTGCIQVCLLLQGDLCGGLKPHVDFVLTFLTVDGSLL